MFKAPVQLLFGACAPVTRRDGGPGGGLQEPPLTTTMHQDTGNISDMNPSISGNANDTIGSIHQENTQAAAKPRSSTEIYYISKITEKTPEYHEYDMNGTRLQAIVSTHIGALINRRKGMSCRSGYGEPVLASILHIHIYTSLYPCHIM